MTATRISSLRRRMLQLFGAALLAWPLRHAAAQPKTTTGLRRLRGEATINGRAAAIGDAVRPGDTVVTGPGAEAWYVVGNDAFLQREATTVRFGGSAADFLRVVSGKILSVFGHGDKRITVATATIGIRGTGCYIEELPGRTYFCLCYGEADIVPTAAPQERETIRTTHHDHPIYIHADPAMPKSMVPAGVENHTDAELTALEALVGRAPPFVGQDDRRY